MTLPVNKFLSPILFQIKNHWKLLIVLLASLILRLYRLPEMASFDFDQEYAANFALQVYDYPIRLVGQGLSVQGLFMGPWYFYLLTPFYFLTNFHPIGGAVGSVILGVITVWVYYYVATKMFGRAAGLMAAFLRGILVIYITYDWSVVPSYSSDLVVLLIWYWLYLYWQNQKPRTIYIGVLLGLLTSWHPIQFPFYIIFMLIVLASRPRFNLSKIASFLLGFILPVSPLIMFEYFRNFAMTRQIIAMLTSPSQSTFDFSSRLFSYLDTITNHLSILIDLPLHFNGGWFLALILIFSLIFLAVKSSNQKLHYWGLVSMVIIFVYYLFFPTHVPEYYLSGITVLITIYTSISAIFLTQSKLGNLILAIWVLGIIAGTYTKISELSTYPSHTNLAHKLAIVNQIKSLSQDNPVYISYITELGWKFGYQYLLDHYQVNQASQAQSNQVFTIVAPISMAPDDIDFRSGNIGLIYPD